MSSPILAEPLLLEVTRLVARGWTAHRPTGIDRVTHAYMCHYGPRSRAVIQHRGVFKILTLRDSQRLWAILTGPEAVMRLRIAAFAPGALLRAATTLKKGGGTYINVSHTDFDLPRHVAWVQQSQLRPIYFIHDLIPIMHPDYCRPHAVRRHRGRVINALRHGAGIIVNSQATASDLALFARREGLPLPPVVASWLAGASFSEAGVAEAACAEDYFVCLGTIEPRKNHALLLDHWEQLTRRRGAKVPRLVMIGQWGHGSDIIRQRIAASPSLQRHVTVLNRCSDNEMQRWLTKARALLMPTLAEGFGLPMVEALSLGTPVIASDLPCLAEVGQGIPTLLDPKDCEAWREILEGFDSDHPEFRRQRAQMNRFRAPSWTDHFEAVDELLFGSPTQAIQQAAEAVGHELASPLTTAPRFTGAMT